ncbi:MAG TPA: hypothetical protein VN708_26560 [Terriglobales bacterium]|nr:hypothetical protein [Terriglobales bacterium]
MKVLERAREFLAQQSPAVSGQNGHKQTFKVACRLVRRFPLERRDALQVLAEYNKRCRPPWSPDELAHKLDDAYKAKAKGDLKGGVKADQSDSGKPVSTCPPGWDAFWQAPAARPKPLRCSIRPGTYEQLLQVAQLRGIRPAGLLIAQQRGVLVFGQWFDYPVWGFTDQSGNILEYRRLDGLLFPAVGNLGERKPHTVKNSRKSWPVGILEAKESPCIALVEGGPDFLACHDLALREMVYPACAPVAMMSASPSIHEEALPHFAGKTVRIFPHVDADGAGYAGASKWQRQLRAAGAARVDIFDFTQVEKTTGVACHDLNEFLQACNEATLDRFPFLKSILPCNAHAKS